MTLKDLMTKILFNGKKFVSKNMKDKMKKRFSTRKYPEIEDGSYGKIILKQNCRIGSHLTILSGISIEKNSIIGAHSLVNKNIPNNVIAFGVPAKIIRQLNNDE